MANNHPVVIPVWEVPLKSVLGKWLVSKRTTKKRACCTLPKQQLCAVTTGLVTSTCNRMDSCWQQEYVSKTLLNFLATWFLSTVKLIGTYHEEDIYFGNVCQYYLTFSFDWFLVFKYATFAIYRYSTSNWKAWVDAFWYFNIEGPFFIVRCLENRIHFTILKW